MKLSAVRAVSITVFVLGIAGMIVGSIADNNGTAIAFGIATALAAICLIVATASQNPPRLTFDESTAQRMESTIQDLVSEGADEQELRDLVRQSVELGRGAVESR